MNKKELLSKYMSELGKKARKLKPYSKDHYRRMQQLSTQAKKKNEKPSKDSK
jgi:hypothetical protein